MTQYFQTSRDSHGVLTLTLDSPEGSVNVVTPEWLAEMEAAFRVVRDDSAIRGVIITSGKAGFMAGADLNYMLEKSAGMSLEQGYALSQQGTRLHRLIETCGKPVVAAINGHALGGGYELALACHMRIVVDDPGVKVGLPEVNFGLLPGSGGTQRLPRMIGLNVALDVLLEGKTFPPAKALTLGLVDSVVPREQLLPAAKVWLAANPAPAQPWDRKGFTTADSGGLLNLRTAALGAASTAKLLARYGRNYPAPVAILTCVFEGIQVPIDAGLRIESRHFATLITSATARNLIRTTFVNRHKAGKRLDRPAGAQKRVSRKLGVLGAGMMGSGIAVVAAVVGIDVVLLDTSQEMADRGKTAAAKALDRALESGRITQQQREGALNRIAPTTRYEDLSGADLVIEAVFEDTGIKADVTRKALAQLDRDVLFASNTSTLPISQLAEAAQQPENFIGLHFFSPVDRMALVEVIRGRRTSDATLLRALDFVAQIRKVPIVVNDRRGFYTSRVFQTFTHEGLHLLREGVAPALIENAARLAGFPVGPLAVLDEVTLELARQVVLQAEREDPEFRRPQSLQVLDRMIDEFERPGRKAGGGFYDYRPGAAKRLWSGLAGAFPPAAQQPDVDEVSKRLLYIQALESARCLEESVLTHPADADVGSTLGWSYPSWTGGALSLVDTVGAAKFVAECERFSVTRERFKPTPTLRSMAQSGVRFHG
jgi:3-hydroxyacyl-CoA dehydrogenase/enoyl-CoA hydratase/3-hydroxybutyryl-CoA epimerase